MKFKLVTLKPAVLKGLEGGGGQELKCLATVVFIHSLGNHSHVTTLLQSCMKSFFPNSTEWRVL